MNPLEERLNRLETRVTRYRNFNVLLCLLLVTVVTVAAKDGVSQFQANSARHTIAMPKALISAFPISPDRGVPDVLHPDTSRRKVGGADTGCDSHDRIGDRK